MKDDIKQSNAANSGGTNGSLGNAKASDLERGYTSEIPDETHSGHSTPDKRLKDGFAGRSH